MNDRQIIDTINQLIHECTETATELGWDDDRTFGDDIALMHSELSEALEEYRGGRQPGEAWYGPDDKPEGVPSEFADVLIRIFHCAGRHGIPLGEVLVDKMAFNKTRPFRHGGKNL